MGSSGKKKTTMAKLTRERKLRERRIDKQAKKDARKNAPADDSGLPSETLTEEDERELDEPSAEPPVVARAFTDA